MVSLDTPAVSVVMPTQGRRASLRSALASVLMQGGAEFEVLVIDDAPADAADWTIDPRWADMFADPRVRIVTSRRALGCAAAKNVGLAAARGDWICYLDDDNVMRPDRLARALEVARKGAGPVVLCGMEIRIGRRRRIRQVETTVFSGDARLTATLADTNVLFHRRDCGVWWDEDLRTTDDAVFFQRLLRSHQVKAVPNVPEPLVVYHVHAGARANSEKLSQYRGQRRLLTVLRGEYARPVRRLVLLRMLVANEKLRPGRWGRFLVLGWRLLREGGVREARPLLNAAGVKLPLTRRWMVR